MPLSPYLSLSPLFVHLLHPPTQTWYFGARPRNAHALCVGALVHRFHLHFTCCPMHQKRGRTPLSAGKVSPLWAKEKLDDSMVKVSRPKTHLVS